MTKTKKNISKNISKNNKCIYTDEAKRIIKNTKQIRKKNKKMMKTMKNNKTK